jgi:hypothetical protein
MYLQVLKEIGKTKRAFRPQPGSPSTYRMRSNKEEEMQGVVVDLSSVALRYNCLY